TERFRVTTWLPDAPHPWALIEPFPHDGPDPDADATDSLQSLLRRSLALTAELGEPAAPATIELKAPPAVVVDVAASLAPIGPLDKQALLGCVSRAERCERLARMLADEIEVLEARIRLR
ncbi:MAG: hypothetical protein OES57_14795, partial [Acidimicrobiia bacterium]|nr:hypothetical protein [Acidimicrobiia bacterium]